MKKIFITLMLLLGVVGLRAQNGITVTGIVTEQGTGAPISGAAIQVKGMAKGATTNPNGTYMLTDVPADATLIFSVMGMTTDEVSVGGRTTINFSLSAEAELMDDIVVIGYGSAKAIDLTSPIAVVKSKEITKQAVSNPMQALQGKVSGVMVSSSGEPGSAPQVRVRGMGTVESSAQPLYVVDGMFVSDISFVSTNDIESMTILKDASSAAIYGVRAANGVVLITTKKGSSVQQAPVVSYNGYVGVQTVSRKFKMANADQYKTLIDERFDILGNPHINWADHPGNTNWLKDAFKNAFMHSHELSVTGNSGKSAYYFGLGYVEQDGIAKNSDYQRINLRASQDVTLSKYFKTGYNISLSYSDENNTFPNAIGSSFLSPPSMEIRNPDGSYASSSLTDIANPAAQFFYNKFNKNRVFKYLPNIYLEITPVEGLKFRSSVSIEGSVGERKIYIPQYYVSSRQRQELSELRISNATSQDYTIDNTLTYTKSVGKHNFTGMVGVSAIQFKSRWDETGIQDVPYVSEASLYISNGDISTLRARDNGNKVRSMSYFGRLLYNYDNKYMVTATLRRDGSSAFPKDNRWATTPSVGLGWVVTNEDFMKNNGVLDYFKLRANWGVMGNNNIPANAYQMEINTHDNLSTIYGPYGSGTISQGASVTRVKALNLKWETVHEYDLGFDMRMLDNRLNMEFDYYHRTTKDAIVQFPLLGSLGSSDQYVLKNNADIRNTGFEMSLGWSDKIGKDFTYTIGGNLSWNKNRIQKIYSGNLGYYTGMGINGNQAIYTKVGQSVGSFYVMDAIGIFQNQAEIDNYKSADGTVIQPNAKPGDFIYADHNGDGIIDDQDRVFAGSYLPKVVYGFNIGFNYKSFDFSMDFQGVGGNKIYNFKRILRFGNENYDKDFFDHRWHGEGTSNTYPSADINGRQNSIPNTFWVESGAYLRLRTVQLGYTLPESASRKIGLPYLRVYVSAQNPFTFTKYNGMSPEIASVESNRQFADIGLFRSTEQGIDNQVYPLSSIYYFGVNIKF